MQYKNIYLLYLLFYLFTACSEEEYSVIPNPSILTNEATGYYCNMTITDHEGPKGQIHLNNTSKTIWFSSVRDTIAFTLLPEEPKDIEVIYVSDMSALNSWENSDNITWINAKKAFYVINSSKLNGMGVAEVIPFKSKRNAAIFIKKYGGNIIDFYNIPKNYVLEIDMNDEEHKNM
jgi:copper chaperone NosL